MSEIEKMKRYIELTKVPVSRYQLDLSETFALSHMAKEKSVNAVITAFEYGRAKGYRAAKAEGRRK